MPNLLTRQTFQVYLKMAGTETNLIVRSTLRNKPKAYELGIANNIYTGFTGNQNRGYFDFFDFDDR